MDEQGGCDESGKAEKLLLITVVDLTGVVGKNRQTQQITKSGSNGGKKGSGIKAGEIEGVWVGREFWWSV